MDREEFASFYAVSFPRLVGQLSAMTGDQPEAQDAVQEAFVRAWVHRHQIDTDREAEGWVRVTAWRIAVSRWRRAREGIRLTLLAAHSDVATPDGKTLYAATRQGVVPISTATNTPGKAIRPPSYRGIPALWITP